MKTRTREMREKVRAAALTLLRDALFFFRFVQQIGELGIVGEQRNCLILFLAGMTKAFDKPVSVLKKGASSTGKSESVKATLSFFPPECVSTRASLSRKAPAYGAGDLSGKILYIAEYRGAKDALYLTRLLQSEGRIEHEYTTVTGRKRGTVVATRKGIPVVFSTTTERRVFEDDETRFLSIQADDSPEQTQGVIVACFSSAPNQQRGTNLSIWQEAIRIACQKVPRFRHPVWFNYLAKHIPTGEPRARRDAVRFLSLLKAVALCRSYSDGRIRQCASEIEINFADYCVAHRILAPAFTSTFAGAHPRALELADGVRALSEKLDRPVAVKELAKKLAWDGALVYKYAKEAAAAKLIDYEPGFRVWNVKRLLPGIVSSPGFLPDPQLIFHNCPETGKDVSYLDPLTGKAVVLRRTRWTLEAE
jgi:hypothetical protein